MECFLSTTRYYILVGMGHAHLHFFMDNPFPFSCVSNYLIYDLILAVHPNALPDYEGVDTSDPNCVVLGDATDAFTYQSLNHAFKLLIDQQKKERVLISLGKG